MGSSKQRLTNKQEKFVQCLIKGMSQRQAYKASYDTKKMKNETIDTRACELLKNSKVEVRYNELRERIIKESEEEAIFQAKDYLKEIASIANDDIGNYLEYKTVKRQKKNNKGEVTSEWDEVVVMVKDSTTVNTKNISEISKGNDGSFKFKTYCRDKALYKLADYIGINSYNKARIELEKERMALERERLEVEKMKLELQKQKSADMDEEFSYEFEDDDYENE